MRNSKMLTASLVTLATVIVCYLGIRSELMSVKSGVPRTAINVDADSRSAADEF